MAENQVKTTEELFGQPIKTTEELFPEQPDVATLQRIKRVEAEAQVRPGPKGIFGVIKDIPAGMLGAAETAVGVATGIPAYLSGLGTAGIQALAESQGAGIFGIDSPRALLRKFGERLPEALERVPYWTYQPFTEKGKQYTQEVGKIFGVVNKLAETAAPFYSSDPDEQTAIREILTLGAFVAGAKVVGGIASAIKVKAPLEIGKLKRAIFESKEMPGTIKKRIAKHDIPDVIESKAKPLIPEHVAEAGWSPEALARGRTVDFYTYNPKTKTTTPLIGVEAIDILPKAREIKVQVNKISGEVTILDAGEGVIITPTLRADIKARFQIRERLPKELIDPIEKVGHMYDVTEVALKQKAKVSPRELYYKTKRNIVDVSGNIKRQLLKEAGELGEEAMMHHDLIRGATSRSGALIEEAVSNIYGDLSASEIGLLNRTIQSKRTMAISAYKPEVKHPHGLTGAEHLEYIKTVPKKITQKADAYFKVMSDQLTQLHKEGLLSDALYSELRSQGDYSPRRFIQYIDPDRTYVFEGRKTTVPDSGIKRLTTGSEQVMEVNSQMLLSDVITRTQTRIFKNRANQALHQVALQFPDNGIVHLAKVVGKTKDGIPVYEKAPAGYERISVMAKGQEIEMLMPWEWAKEWVTTDPLINAQLANIIGWVSGSKILKPMATGLNPGFAITNFPRDIAHIWITTGEYSSFAPKFLAQMGRDLATTFADTWLRKGRFKDYIDEGGGMQFLTHQGRITKKTSGPLRKLQQVLGYLGETSELWTRLSLRERALRRGRPPVKATWIARNYLDFSQGGPLVKAVDTGVPYVNAAVQATRGVFRRVADSPMQSMWKFAQLGTLATGAYLANRFGNPECWNSISNEGRVNYWNITTPLKYTDKEGNVKYLYFKIAKDQAQRVLATVFENLMAKALGDEVDGEQIAKSVADFIPYNPVGSLPPTLDAMLGYFANKDFWTNKDIWKGSEVVPKEEYTKYTHPMLVKTGEITGLSPERLRHVLQQYFTYGNIYTSIVGEGLNAILGQLPEQYKDKTTMEIITQQPIIRRMLSSTRPGEEFRQELDKLKLEENTRRFMARRTLDDLTTEYFREKDETGVENQSLKHQIRAHIKTQPEAEQGLLTQRFYRMGRLYRIPDKGWWLTLASMPPEARATAFFSRWATSDEEEKKKLRETMIRVPGIRSDRFDTRLVALFNKVKGEKK